MGAPTPTKIAASEFAGDLKVVVYSYVPTAASDTVTFVAATHKFRKIYAVIAQVTEGQDSALQTAHATINGLAVTIATLNAAGASSSDYTSAVVTLTLIVGSST
jgi:hypothetical protein